MGCTAYSFQWNGKHIIVSDDIIATLLDGHFCWSRSIDFDKKRYLQSLQKFTKIDSDLMLPGHGMVYFGKPRQRVEQAFNSMFMRACPFLANIKRHATRWHHKLC
jgi:glyoxylase-like metal-dependent hydrolase (beta-lactamase superfamily II)